MFYKNIFGWILLQFMVFAVFAQTEVNSNISTITIYSNKAQVNRTAQLALKKGENKLIFYNLENGIEPNNINISASEKATVINSFIRHQDVPINTQPKFIQDIHKDLQKLAREKYLKEQKIKNLNEEKQVILQNKVALGEDGFNLAKLDGLTAYYRKSLNEIDKILYDDNQELKLLNAQHQELNRKFQESGYRAKANALHTIIIAEADISVPVQIQYIVNTAGWTPIYDIKSDGVDPKINATLKANIYQNTGVNWNGVKISLSTAQPISNQVIPEVHPWVLRFSGLYKNKLEEKAILNRAYKMSANTDDRDDAGYNLKPLTTAVENMTSKEFQLNVPLTINGNNGRTVMVIDDYILSGFYQYFAVPKYNTNVYLTAYLIDWEQYDLLPGNANLFLGSDFVGTTFVNTSKYGDSLQLPLGIDKGVSVKRTRIQDVSKKSFLGRFTQVEMGMKVEVKNNKKIPIEMTIKDQVPISSSEEIEVIIREISDAKHTENTGELMWKVTLQPGTSKTYKIRYLVKYPSAQTIENF